MGMNYSFVLFFDRDYVWEALRGIARVSSQHQPPTKIILPNRQISVPLEPYSSDKYEMHHTERKLEFQIMMHFSAEDQEIIKYGLEMGYEGADRCPPDAKKGYQIGIGYIYLSIYLNDPIRSSQDWVLFEFYAASTTMSFLFAKSTSIQNGFIELLRNYHGISGALDRELDGGRLFWFRGNVYDVDMFAYNLPDQIELLLKSDNEGKE
jgi:hypothetical protein